MSLLRSLRLRKGLTLVEMTFAISIAATFTVMTLGTIAKSIQMRRQAQQMSLASTLAQAKLAQLLSYPMLEVKNETGEMGNAGPYAHFKYSLKITEEQIDLAAVSSEGKLTNVPVDDRLDPKVQNGLPRERAGQGATTQTGGLVDINRIILVIEYPIGSGTETLRIETFKSAAKTTKP